MTMESIYYKFDGKTGIQKRQDVRHEENLCGLALSLLMSKKAGSSDPTIDMVIKKPCCIEHPVEKFDEGPDAVLRAVRRTLYLFRQRSGATQPARLRCSPPLPDMPAAQSAHGGLAGEPHRSPQGQTPPSLRLQRRIVLRIGPSRPIGGKPRLILCHDVTTASYTNNNLFVALSARTMARRVEATAYFHIHAV
mgnify:CR=1 FL=1